MPVHKFSTVQVLIMQIQYSACIEVLMMQNTLAYAWTLIMQMHTHISILS